MRKYLFKWSLIAFLCVAAIPAIGQTTDSGNYGFHLQLSKDQYTYIQTGIYFYTHASDRYVASEDAANLYEAQAPVILASYSSDYRALSINTLSDYVNGKRIRLYVAANSSGTYNLSLADIFGMDTVGYAIYLVDRQKKDSVDIVNHPNYSFFIDLTNPRSFGANRFLVEIKHKSKVRCKSSSFWGQNFSPASIAHIYAVSGIKIQYQNFNAALWTNDISARQRALHQLLNFNH